MSHSAPQSECLADPQYDLLPIGVCIIDRELNLHSWNRTLTQWTGISRESALQKKLSDLSSEQSFDRYHVRIRDVFESRQSVVLSPSLHRPLISVTLGSKADELKMVQRVTIQPMPDNADRALICIDNVTTQYLQNAELRRERQKLQLNESRMRAINNATPEGVMLTGADGTILEVNPAGLQLLGATANEELVGRSLYEFPMPEYREAVMQMTERICEGNRLAIEYVVEGLRGTRRWMRMTAVPLELGDDLTSQLLLFWDITEQKRSEIELRKARDEAQAANRAKNEFLANMSHEIRTPMTAIMGYADLLHSSVTDPETLEITYSIKRNGEHLLEIINDILDYSNLDISQLRLECKNCCPVQLINECVKRFRSTAESKSLELNLQYQGLIPSRIFTNPDRLRQILTNIVGNAIKFTETGSVNIVVSSSGKEEGMLLIDVIDTGIGIRADDMQSLFEPFTQADYSLSRKYGGTGLGLAISRYLAENLGGTIKVESQIGKGSRFSISVGVGDLSGVPMLGAESLNPSGTTTVIRTNLETAEQIHGRILLVEDGADNQRLISYLLKKAGLDVSIAEHGQEALVAIYGQWPISDSEIIAHQTAGFQNPFDLILMDMQMPVMDGYTAAQTLRQLGNPIPIVAVTAHAMEGDREKCLDAGCDDYITKPISKTKMLDAVCRYLEKSRVTSGG